VLLLKWHINFKKNNFFTTSTYGIPASIIKISTQNVDF
jgi:hypothetical protein